MKRRVVVLWFAMTLFVLSTALTKAQPCIDVRIEGSIDNAIIDGCATEIVLSAESGANFQSWLSGGGSVHLYVVKENNSEIDSSIAATVLIDSLNNTLVVQPNVTLPIHRDGATEPINYQLVLRYVEGDSTVQTFWKQHVFVATAEARSLVDSTDISDQVAVVPFVESSFFVREGCLISADLETGGWVFDHWTVDDEDVRVDHRASEQLVTNTCWPLQRTVTFTAWYRPTTASVPDGQPSSKISVNKHEIILHREIDRISQIKVCDISGSIVERYVVSPGDQHVLKCDLGTGFYVLVIGDHEHPGVISFIVPPY